MINQFILLKRYTLDTQNPNYKYFHYSIKNYMIASKKYKDNEIETEILDFSFFFYLIFLPINLR